ncbi:MAG: hypothetical protein AAB725_02135 [Patescibacteria group bacterium]
MLNQVIPDIYKTYLSVMKNSVGSEIFKNFYAKVNDKKQDIMEDGKLSCAFYVSSILAMFKLIYKIHGTVDGTVRDLEKNGWERIQHPEPGSVLVWEEQESSDGKCHKHIGFYVGNDEAISNSSKLGKISKHNWTFNKSRKVENIFWNKKILV